MARKPCPQCAETEHCKPACPTLYWPDGHKRGSRPGPPPARSQTLAEEMNEIFAGARKEIDNADRPVADG